MSDQQEEWTTELIRLPYFDDNFVNVFYSGQTTSEKHSRRSYNFMTESFVELRTMKTRSFLDQSGRRLHQITAGCFRSQKKTGTPYRVTVTLSEAPWVESSACACTAGSSGHCCHTVAVLKTVARLLALGYKHIPDELACTELPQQWGRPRAVLAPENVMQVNWRRLGEDRPEEPLHCKLSDVRKKEETVDEKRSSVLQFAESVKGMVGGTLSDTLESAAHSTYVDTKYGPALENSVMAVQLSCLPFDFKSFVALSQGQDISTCRAHGFTLFQDCPEWSLPENSNSSVLMEIRISAANAQQLEQDTRKQARSTLWEKERRNRLSSSRFGHVCKRQKPWTEVALRNLLRPKQFSAASVRYGTSNEHNAVLRYIEVLRHIRHHVHVFACGFMVRPDFPWLGSTPDRIVYDPEQTPAHGVLEVKCPWSKRATSLEDALQDKDFCIEVRDGKPHLKEHHEYYYQMMGQMFCSGARWGHCVVYSPSWIIVAKVDFCPSFCDEMIKVLTRFYFDCALPYLEASP
ncbi:uncharacterized protein LOC135386434 [Ornithodoros turicata]|uniref:uncharacterized protein LOC135386434 n=1 Tax=Ornithodoros turicata TaxID=34597 RepID=UPI0031389B46